MNKYQEALKMFTDYQDWLKLKGLLVNKENVEIVDKNSALLQELVDRANEQFSHILHVHKPGHPARVAFHTSKEAHEYAREHDLKGCHLESIQFGKV